jgi:hypothetical protein
VKTRRKVGRVTTEPAQLYMGIDIGGTFTDVVLSGPTRIGPFLTKTLTTPDALGQEVSAENFPERLRPVSMTSPCSTPRGAMGRHLLFLPIIGSRSSGPATAG